jgi:hypothetical protein
MNKDDLVAIEKNSIPRWRGSSLAALRDFYLAHDRFGSCVTSIAGPNGDAQLYER